MQTTQQLSPEYGLSLIRLTAGERAWPGLLLHSRTLTWVFDRHARILNTLAVQSLSLGIGLHQVTDPFTTSPPPEPWAFRLPTLRRHAQLTAPGILIDVTRTPHITDDWWGMAVTHGSRCRLLVAAGMEVPDDPGDAADALTEAAADGRVFGATIGVDF